MVSPFGPSRSDTVTFTLSRPFEPPLPTTWNDSYSPRAAASDAVAPLAAASVMPTRCRLGAVQTFGLAVGAAKLAEASERAATAENKALLLVFTLLIPL